MQTTSNSSSLGLLAGNPWLREVQVIDLAVGELERNSGRRALSLVLGERLLAIGPAVRARMSCAAGGHALPGRDL